MSFRVRLSEIAEIVMGQSPTGDECNNVGDGIPLLNGPTEFTERFPAPVQFTIKGRKFSKSGDILFCVRGSTTGRMNYADQVYAIGRGIGAIRGINGYPTPYIRAVLELNLERLLAAATGSTFPNVGKDLLNDFEVEVSTPEDANKINKLIVALEEKKFLNTQTNQTLESIAQAIFKSWFVDFDPVKAKMSVLAEGGTREQAELAAMSAISGKNEIELAQMQKENVEHYSQLAETAALFPSAMVESELGEIPEGWEVGCIGDIAFAKGGYAFKSNEFESIGSKVVKIKNITGDGRVDLTDCDCVKDPQPDRLDKFKVINGDLLMAMTEATVGKIGIAVSGNDCVYLNQRVAKFDSKIKTQKVSWFLFPCIQQKSIFDVIVGSAQGSAQPNISSSEIERTEIVVPNENLISEYCELVDPIFCKWMTNNIQNIELANLRDSLLPKLLSGEIYIEDNNTNLNNT